MRKVPDEVDQLPTVQLAAVISITGECGHTREPHTIFDNPEYFAIGQILRFGQTQIGRLGVEALANHGVATAVVGVAQGAVIRKVQPRVAQIFG